jgi:hypothetical protein
VPDARIEADSPRIKIHAVPKKSFPVFGRVKRVVWELCDVLPYQPDDVSRRVAENLNHDTTATQLIMLGELFGLHVDAYPPLGCWRIWGSGPQGVPEFNGLWNCYQAIAKALLAMPMPTVE